MKSTIKEITVMKCINCNSEEKFCDCDSKLIKPIKRYVVSIVEKISVFDKK